MSFKKLKAFYVLVCCVALFLGGAEARAFAEDQDQILKSEFFAQITFRETPFADIRGAYPMSAEKAKNYKHYRFDYNLKGQLIKVTFGHGERPQYLNGSQNYLVHSPIIKISYEGNQEIRTFFDAFMNPMDSNGVFKEVYDLDPLGNRVALRNYDSEGNLAESNWGIAKYVWEIDRRGTVTEQRYDLQGNIRPLRRNFPFFCLKLHYDNHGLLAMMENYGNTCEKLTENTLNAAQDKLEYNNMGHIYAWNVYDAEEKRSIGNQPMVARGIMIRDEMGHTIRQYHEDEKGNPIASSYGWTNSLSEYDQYGNLLNRYNYTGDGSKKLNNPNLGYSGYKMTYDEEGRHRLLIEYFDADGSPTVHKARGYHAARTDYNKAGNLVEIRYEDEKGNLVARTDNCVAVIKHFYDEKDRRISTEYFDSQNQPINQCPNN